MEKLPAQRLRWGILSTARIGLNAVIPALQASNHADVVAISSRNAEHAAQIGAKLDIPQTYGSYEALLADPKVDVVYNPLPNHLHLPLTLAALAAGKHVLCEKPLTLSAEEVVLLAEAVTEFPKLKVMEAFMYRFHPQWEQVQNWISAGEIGRVQSIRSVFTYFNDDPANIRNGNLPGGGGLLDVGCYCISVTRWLMGREPKRIMGLVENDPVFGVDRLVTALMDFDGVQASFVCGTQTEHQQMVEVIGTAGRILVETPFFQPNHGPAKLTLIKEGHAVVWESKPINIYVQMCEAFTAAILGSKPIPIPLVDSLANMRTIDAIIASHEQGKWVEILESESD